MKCTDIQNEIMGHSDECPAELQNHLDQCPNCSEWYRKNKTIQQLLSLKQYETPPPFTHERIKNSILSQLDKKNVSISERILSYISIPLVPAWRVAVAVLLLILVSIQMIALSELEIVKSFDVPQEIDLSGDESLAVPETILLPDCYLRYMREKKPTIRVNYGPEPLKVTYLTDV